MCQVNYSTSLGLFSHRENRNNIHFTCLAGEDQCKSTSENIYPKQVQLLIIVITNLEHCPVGFRRPPPKDLRLLVLVKKWICYKTYNSPKKVLYQLGCFQLLATEP